jgi:DNA-binding NtrC family response regulator
MSDAKTGLVLLLEDDWRSAEALALLLDDWGYECVHGPSFEAVLPAVRERAGEVRAVISDYHLQDGATGIEAARRTAEHGVAAPVLLLTGTLRGAARQAAGMAGYRFMEKPVAPERLKAWLDEAVASHV